MKRRAVIEEAIGETRAAVYEGRRLTELHLRRSTRKKAYAGDICTGRVVAVDPAIAGAFVDIGEEKPGVLKFSGHKDLPKLTEGLHLDVKITKAGIGGKGPNLTYIGPASLDKAGPVKALSLEAYLSEIYPNIDYESAPVSIIDTACERTLALKCGGSVTFEQTQALLAIDVDKGSANTAMDACLQAADLIASQLRLRGLGGLIAIDFPNLRQPKQRNSLMKSLERAFADDPSHVRIAPFSRFGVIEMTRSQSGPSLDQILHDRAGNPTAETLALRGLRRLEREKRLNPGAKMTLFLPFSAHLWLTKTDFDWKAELQDRIGQGYEIQPGDEIDVKADR